MLALFEWMALAPPRVLTFLLSRLQSEVTVMVSADQQPYRNPINRPTTSKALGIPLRLYASMCLPTRFGRNPRQAGVPLLPPYLYHYVGERPGLMIEVSSSLKGHPPPPSLLYIHCSRVHCPF